MTVASFPQAIFVLAACILFTIVVLLAGIWPSSATPYSAAMTDPEGHPFDDSRSDDITVVDERGSLSRRQSNRGRDPAGVYKYNGVGTSPPRTDVAGLTPQTYGGSP